jgi:predicted transcriptional regulator
MDYMLAGAFAQIVGLICNYIGIRNDKKINPDDFMNWINEHHQELANYIEKNNKVADEIKRILDTDREVLLQRFDGIDEILAAISSSLEFTAGLAHAIRPEAVLSDQAIHILEGFVDSGGEKLVEILSSAGNSVQVAGYTTEFNITDQRFLRDDLKTLDKFGFISYQRANNVGGWIFCLTRAGERFIREYKRNK